MQFESELYGRIANRYFPTGYNSKDWDAMESRIAELEAEVERLREVQSQAQKIADGLSGKWGAPATVVAPLKRLKAALKKINTPPTQEPKEGSDE